MGNLSFHAFLPFLTSTYNHGVAYGNFSGIRYGKFPIMVRSNLDVVLRYHGNCAAVRIKKNSPRGRVVSVQGIEKKTKGVP